MENVMPSIRALASALVEHAGNYAALIDQSIVDMRAQVMRRALCLIGAFLLLQTSLAGFMVLSVLSVENGPLQHPSVWAIPGAALAVSVVLGLIGLRSTGRPTRLRSEMEADLAAARTLLGDPR
ncbi:MAG: hypothetical protein GC151_01465 [Betaproteobacteria bacterium]|nr:hypothetical protein [Betaproteobacteria bacterium]